MRNNKNHSTTEALRRGERKKNYFWRFIPRFFLSLCVPVVIWVLSSCAEMSKDMGLNEAPDIEQREGPGGPLSNPEVLDPFQKYSLVMAAEECRFFQMKLPQQWYWKLSVTVDNRRAGSHGKLKIRVLPSNPPWSPLGFFKSEKVFELGRESIQGVIGVENKERTQTAILQICQEGPPLRVTLESQVASFSGMMVPPEKNDDQE